MRRIVFIVFFYVCAIYFSNVCKWGFYYLVSQSLFLVLWLFQIHYPCGKPCAIDRHYPWLKRGKYKNGVSLHIIKHIVQLHLVLFCEVQKLYTFLSYSQEPMEAVFFLMGFIQGFVLWMHGKQWRIELMFLCSLDRYVVQG